jgi:phosphotransferase system enzyme I (PtsI)
MAGDVRYTCLLLALGLTEFSMHPGLLLEVREQVNACDRARLLAESKVLLRAVTREGILHVLKRLEACVEKPAGDITQPA